MLDYEIDFWNNFTDLYFKTKEMYIKAEEYDDDFCSIMQPIKEQRDALDHIIRSYTELIKSNNGQTANQDYIQKNFDKALGHIYRAFYDTADILTIVLREHISKNLQGYSYKEIISVWDKYSEVRPQLIDVTKRIVALRLKKEIKSSSKEQQKIFDEYKSIIDFLFKTLDTILIDVYPKLNK